MRFTALLLTLASLFGSTYAQPTPANVVCYQTIVGSSASYADVSASLDAWSQEMYSTLGLSGPVALQVGHAQVPDRVSFENGCNGPYNTVADLFVHIQATGATYDAISDSLEAFIASHPVTSLSTISCAARSVVDELPTCGKVPQTGNNPTQPDEVPTPDNVVCYQEIVGSLTGTYAQVSAALDAWSLKMYNALGLTGPIELQVGHAQVPDRTSFENGCNGPYTAVADLFVHIQTTAANYDAVSAALEAFIAANPLTNSEFAPISCSARSVVTFLPRCGKNAPAPAVTQAPATTAPTTPVGTNPTQQPEVPTPADVVCYQEIVGSLTGTYAQVSAALSAWSLKMYNALGLTGDIELHVGHAQVPDRNSFENGCNGPYTAVADLFVHIQTTNANYDAVSAALEAFIAANPLTNSEFAPISCSARSVVTYLPTCGKTPSTPTGANPTQPGEEVPTPANVVCYQEVVGSLTGTYAQVSADLDDWQQKMYVALGLTGPIELQVGHAQIPDRVSFENGCNGPYATMADLFVHIQTTQANYDAVSAALEAFISTHPLTAYASIDCSARSVVTYLPTCGKTEGTPTGRAPPQQDDTAQLCYQEVVGSLTGTYAQVSAALDAWQLKMYTELGLTGPIELTVGHAQIPDRVNFENGCNGPYATMADLFVHIPTTFGQYDALSARLEAFIAANPLTSLSPISCSARSNVAELPSCGKVPNPPVSTPTGANQPQPGGSARSCPVTTYTSSITDSGAAAAAGKRLYTISYDMANGDADIQFIDVHITTASGFYNARMSLSASASPASPSYEFVFPEYLALGQGEAVSWWFTTAINIPEQPGIWACDSASTSFTTPGTPVGNNPTAPPAATGPCPAIAFNNAIVRTGAGETTGTGAYAITFANASPARTVEWVDVHLTANGGQFNYRMDLSPDATPTSVSFITNLPSPYLNLAPGAQVSYWFTYESQGTACDSSTFAFTATAL